MTESDDPKTVEIDVSLTVSEYEDASKKAEESACNRILEASCPEHFQKAGYPTTVATEQGLARYVDVMHELRDPIDYKELLGGFTAPEFHLFKGISNKVAEFTEKKYGKRILPKGALTRSIFSYRHIKMLAKPENTTVFEVGPGSGYLGALLASDGYRYCGTDITQAFYLYQSHLWQALFGKRFVELVTDDATLADLDKFDADAVVHIPWWKFTLPDPSGINPKVDIFVVNHALCEMNHYSMVYTIKLALQWLRHRDSQKIFFIEGPGANLLRSRDDVYAVFHASGYGRAFGDDQFDVFVPDEHLIELVPDSTRYLPDLPYALPGGSPISKAARLLLKGDFSTLRQKILEKISGEAALLPIRFPANTLSDTFLKERKAIKKEERVPFNEVRAFQKKLMDDGDVFTDDEKFFHYVFDLDYYS